QLLSRSEGNAAWLAQLNGLLDGLSDNDAGQLLVQLAEGYRKAGRLDLAADTYFLFARRTPDHPLVDSALTWLVQFYASDETTHRLTARTPTSRRAPADETASPGLSLSKSSGGNVTSNLSNVPPRTPNANAVQQAAALLAAAPPATGLSR